MVLHQEYLSSAKKQFQYYRMLGDRSFSQLTEEQIFWNPNDESNSIAVIVQHMYGNMMSRWTDLFDADGEKDWRDRDQEFELYISSFSELIEKWNLGWDCLFDALNAITEENFNKLVFIRNMGHTVVEAINRQLCHYAYHVGQIVYIAKLVSQDWQSLSIPKGQSQSYNTAEFKKEKRRGHFSDQFLNKREEEN
jgi:hypothetical protein